MSLSDTTPNKTELEVERFLTAQQHMMMVTMVMEIQLCRPTCIQQQQLRPHQEACENMETYGAIQKSCPTACLQELNEMC